MISTKALLIYLFCAALGWGLLGWTHLTLNVTDSLTYHGFFCVRGMKVKRGDLVCLKGHETSYTKDLSLTKRLVGLPGDKIELRDSSVWVAEKKIGELQTHTREGNPLTPNESRIIPEGFVFVAADHPRSFDSRYEEFGLVEQSSIQGRCFGLLRKASPS